MTDIARIVIFKKENGEEFTFDDKYVQLTSLENTYEQIKVDIGGTGEIPCYMKSLSPIVGRGPKKTNGEHLNGIFTLSLQQIVAAPDPEEEQNCLDCALSQNGVCSIKDNDEITSCDDFKK